jgi:hypothetical protein
VSPEVILDAARAHVAVADAPRFLKPLAVWLDRRGWEAVPERKGGKPQRTNGHRPGKPDMVNICRSYCDYVENGKRHGDDDDDGTTPVSGAVP